MKSRFEWWIRKLMFFPMLGIAYYLYLTKIRAKKIILNEGKK